MRIHYLYAHHHSFTREPCTYSRMYHLIFAQVPDLLLADAKRVEVELRRKYLSSDADGPTAHAGTADGHAGADAQSHAFGPLEVRRSQAARLVGIFPASGPSNSPSAVSLRGECLGRAVSAGEISISVLLPKSRAPVILNAAFVSDTKLSYDLPRSPTICHNLPRSAAISCDLRRPDLPHAAAARAHLPHTAASSARTLALYGRCVLPPSAHAGKAQVNLAGAVGGGAIFSYYGTWSAARLKPTSGPLHGGTAVRVIGSGFVQAPGDIRRDAPHVVTRSRADVAA